MLTINLMSADVCQLLKTMHTCRRKEQRNERLKIRRKARRAEHYSRVNRSRSLVFDGRYGGPKTSGVPSIGEMRLPSYMEVMCQRF